MAGDEKEHDRRQQLVSTEAVAGLLGGHEPGDQVGRGVRLRSSNSGTR